MPGKKERESLLKITVDEILLRKLAKEEIQKHLKDIDGSGTWWDLKRLESETCRKRDWLIENILLNPRFKDEMKCVSNGRDSGRWMFQAAAMRTFLNKYFQELNGKQGVRHFEVAR